MANRTWDETIDRSIGDKKKLRGFLSQLIITLLLQLRPWVLCGRSASMGTLSHSHLTFRAEWMDGGEHKKLTSLRPTE